LALLALVGLLVGLGCEGPMLLLPGGELSGKSTPTPGDWNFAGDYGMAQLETQPENPYSVNIAYTVVDGFFYNDAGDTETQWVQNIAANPLVRFRRDGSLYDLRAARVTDVAEIATFGKAWTDQSLFRRDPAELDEVWIYQLVNR